MYALHLIMSTEALRRMVFPAQQQQAFVQLGMVQVFTAITFPHYNAFHIHLMFFLFFFYSHTKDSNAMLSWELSYLGLKVIPSQFVHGGYGLATNEKTSYSPRELICQYFGRFVVLTKTQTDELFNPIFFGNHERLMLLTSTMQPIVHEHQTNPDTYDQVRFLFLRLLHSDALNGDVFFSVYFKRLSLTSCLSTT